MSNVSGFKGHNSERMTAVLRAMCYDNSLGVPGIILDGIVAREPGEEWPTFYDYVMDRGLKCESCMASAYDEYNPDPAIDPERPPKPWYKVRASKTD